MTDNNRGSNSEFFDLKYVHECFNQALLEEEDVNLGLYLDAYKELCKFCQLMGSVFGFVKSEIESKSEVLEELRKKDENGNFATLKSMICHEKGSKLLDDTKYISGCRTLLRLHRGLDFIKEFLRRVGEMNPEESTSEMGKEVYWKTLGQFHPWLVRQGAYLAMLVLPSRQTLLSRVCGHDVEGSLKMLPPMLDSINQVYTRTQDCFTDHGLLDLP